MVVMVREAVVATNEDSGHIGVMRLTFDCWFHSTSIQRYYSHMSFVRGMMTHVEPCGGRAAALSSAPG